MRPSTLERPHGGSLAACEREWCLFGVWGPVRRGRPVWTNGSLGSLGSRPRDVVSRGEPSVEVLVVGAVSRWAEAARDLGEIARLPPSIRR